MPNLLLEKMRTNVKNNDYVYTKSSSRVRYRNRSLSKSKRDTKDQLIYKKYNLIFSEEKNNERKKHYSEFFSELTLDELNNFMFLFKSNTEAKKFLLQNKLTDY